MKSCQWIIFSLLFVFSAYSQSGGGGGSSSEDFGGSSSERINKVNFDSKPLKRDPINVIIYDLIDQFVDYFQSDVNHKESVSFSKKYQFNEKDKLWEEDKLEQRSALERSQDVELGVEMLSKSTLNVAIVSLDVDKSIDMDAQSYFYREVMSRNYKTKNGQSIHFIDSFIEGKDGISYSLNKADYGGNSAIDEKEVDLLRQKIYFDCYAQLRLVKKGVTINFQVVLFDAKSKGVVLVMDYNKLVAQVGTLPLDFSFYYSLSFGIPYTLYLPMYYSVNLGKKLYGIGSFGFDATFETYNANNRLIGDEAALELRNILSDSDASNSKKRRAVNKYAVGSILLGPYFVLNINELARKKTSIFEFFLGTNFRLGYLFVKTPVYQPLFFDVNFFYRMTIGHWFFIGLGANTVVMYPSQTHKGARRLPLGPVNFVLSLGINVF